MLEDNGIRRGLTQEKIDGTYVRPIHVTEQFLEEERPNYLVEQIKVYFDRYPDMFRRVPNLAQRFIDHLKGNRIKLRKYPDVVAAMFEGKEDEIPEDMICEDNPQKSPLIEKYNQHITRRQSRALLEEIEEEKQLLFEFVPDEEYFRAENVFL